MFDLIVDEGGKMIAKRDRCVSSHYTVSEQWKRLYHIMVQPSKLSR
jgi:hypothetical protein